MTETSKMISSYNIVIDKMHFKGHTDELCHSHYNPYKLEHLNGVSLHSQGQIALYLHVSYQ